MQPGSRTQKSFHKLCFSTRSRGQLFTNISSKIDSSIFLFLRGSTGEPFLVNCLNLFFSIILAFLKPFFSLDVFFFSLMSCFSLFPSGRFMCFLMMCQILLLLFKLSALYTLPQKVHLHPPTTITAPHSTLGRDLSFFFRASLEDPLHPPPLLHLHFRPPFYSLSCPPGSCSCPTQDVCHPCSYFPRWSLQNKVGSKVKCQEG